jgi:hypothetical protein
LWITTLLDVLLDPGQGALLLFLPVKYRASVVSESY